MVKPIKKYLFLILIFASQCFNCFLIAQNRHLIDSVENSLKSEKTNSGRARIYMIMADEYKELDQKLSRFYTEKTSYEVEQINDHKLRTEYKIKIAILQTLNKDTAKAIKTLNEVKEYVYQSRNNELIGAYLSSYGQFLKMNHRETQEDRDKIIETLMSSISYLKNSDPAMLSRPYLILCLFYGEERSNPQELKKLCDEWYNVALKIKDPNTAAKNFGNVSTVYRSYLKKPAEAFKANLKALEKFKEIKDSLKIGELMFNIGMYTKSYGDKKQGIDMMNTGIGITIRNSYVNPKRTNYNLADFYHNIGSSALRQKRYDSALVCLKKALHYNKLSEDERTEPYILGDLGVVYYEMGKKDTAYKIQLQTLELRKKHKVGEGVLFSYGLLSKIAYEQMKYDSAIAYANLSLKVADSVRMHHYDDRNFYYLYLGYKGKKDYDKAIFYLEKAINMKDSMSKSRNEKEIAEIIKNQKDELIRAEYDKKSALAKLELERNQLLLDKNNKELLLLEQENNIKAYNLERSKTALHQHSMEIESHRKTIDVLNLDKKIKSLEAKRKEEAIKQQRVVIYAFGGGGIVVLILLFFVLRGYVQKKKDNEIITEQKNEVQKQKHLIEEKQKEIIDSINYAKRIQNAILATEEEIQKYLPESFLLYKPKDIVAGDFYFFETTSNHIFYAAADCTGHGVPGALVSVVCSNALSRCIKEFNLSDPGAILDKARELVLETFRKSGQNVMDGMDVSLIAIPLKTENGTKKIKWAGANNPLWYLSNGQINEITANKQPIGLVEKPMPFTTHQLEINRNDTLYLFTDGYADQFGGPDSHRGGKKFKYKQLNELLLSLSSLKLSEQKDKLNSVFETWKGDLEQVDDVCVIAVRI